MPDHQPSERELPQTGLLSSSDVYRINSTASKIGGVFQIALAEARDEALWIASVCRDLLRDNDRLRVENEGLRERMRRQEALKSGER